MWQTGGQESSQPFSEWGSDSSVRGELASLVQSHEIQILVFIGRRGGEKFRSSNEAEEDAYLISKERCIRTSVFREKSKGSYF